MRIFVDATGGDLAPQAPVEGTVEALRRNPELTVTLAGIVPEIEKYLAGADDVRSRITLLDAPEVITNHESPVMGVRKKTKSATVLGMLAVRDKEADGFVSAGSTGAVLAGGMFRLGRIPGVERPALAPLMPNGKGYFLLIDCGANVDCKPEYRQYLFDIQLAVLNEYVEFMEADEDEDGWYLTHASTLAQEILAASN